MEADDDDEFFDAVEEQLSSRLSSSSSRSLALSLNNSGIRTGGSGSNLDAAAGNDGDKISDDEGEKNKSNSEEEEEEKVNGGKEDAMAEDNANDDDRVMEKDNEVASSSDHEEKEEEIEQIQDNNGENEKEVEEKIGTLSLNHEEQSIAKNSDEINKENNEKDAAEKVIVVAEKSKESEEDTYNSEIEQKSKEMETPSKIAPPTITAATAASTAMTPIKSNMKIKTDLPSISTLPPPPTSANEEEMNSPTTPEGPLTCFPSSPLDSLLQNAACCPGFTAVMFNTSTSDPSESPTSSPLKKGSLTKNRIETALENVKDPPPPPPARIDEEDEEDYMDDGASVSTTSTISAFQHLTKQGIDEEGEEEEIDESSIFRIVNKDTGETTDIRDLASSGKKAINIDTSYTLFPTKEQLFQTRPSLLVASAMNQHAGGGDMSVASSESGSAMSRSFSYESASSSLNTSTSPRVTAGDTASVVSNTSTTASKKQKFGKKLASFKTSVKKGAAKVKSKSTKSLHRGGGAPHSPKPDEKKSAPPPLETIQTSSSSSGYPPPPSPTKKNPSASLSPRRAKRNVKSPSSALDALPSNSIQVKCYQKPVNTTEYNPMLLLQSIPRAHVGPIWALAFSPSGKDSEGGKYLASGGEDGTICIWAVAPGSRVMHEEDEVFWKEEDVMAGGGDRDDISSIGRGTEDGMEGGEEEPLAPPPVMQRNGPELGTEIQILSSKPIRRFTDHTEHVIDFSWSSTNFLLSASLDKTVRLYHVSRPGCLQIFKHADLVTAVAFHPRDDGYFLSGGSDKKLRVWSILDGRVKDWAQAPEMITAARYTPDARFVVAGLLHGQVYFYDVDGLKYYTQIACRNRHGSQKEGKKVTGLTFMRGVSGQESGSKGTEARREGLMKTGVCTSNTSLLAETDEEHLASPEVTTRSASSDLSPPLSRLMNAVGRNSTPVSKKLLYKDKMLVTTNDSRLRLYGLNDFCMIRKYKGLTNMQMQIRARFNETGDYIVCGSEGGNIYIWNTATKSESLHLKVGGMHNYDRSKSYESFEASRASLPIVTDTVFVPSRGLKESLISSRLFPSLMDMNSVKHDMSSAAIITCDYEGTIRVFLRKTCIDAVYHAAGPDGSNFD